MSVPGRATPFELLIPAVRNDFQVLAFEGTEMISALYALRIELVSENANLDLQSLLRQPAFLRFGAADEGIHGHIEDVVAGKSGQRLTHYQLSLVPSLHYLQFSHNPRIFQNLTVPQIVTQVLKVHGILADRFEWRVGECPVREYCTQYDESDFEFIQRLCSEEGIAWGHVHGPQEHRLLFVDTHNFFPRGKDAVYHEDSSLEAVTPVVSRFSLRMNTRTEKTVRRGYNFKNPSVVHEQAYWEPSGYSAEDPFKVEPGKFRRSRLEDYRYPHVLEDRHAKRLARHALERHRVDHQVAEGRSNEPALRGGRFFKLTDHPRQQCNDIWLLLRVTHHGKQPQVLEESQVDAGERAGGASQGYRNTFSALHSAIAYRPPLIRRKSVLVSQTARVTGPAGQDIHCDEYGRVKVRFHWDRREDNEHYNSCWLRTSSSWAGDSFGALTIPRVGMEVVVTYLEGNPDDPLITGCVPNARTPVPYPLPANNTRTVLRSRSSPARPGTQGGYNELSIEDRSGQELIYLRAQRDMQQLIGNDSRLEIGNQRHELVKGNSVTVLEGEEQRTVGADRKVSLKANDFLQVAGNSHALVGLTQVVEAGQHIHLKAGAHLTFEAGASITLKGGGQHIVIGPGGIFSSTLILPGGVAIPGPGASVLPPGMLEAQPPAAALPLPDLFSYRQHAAAGALLPGACCQPGAGGHCPVHQGGQTA